MNTLPSRGNSDRVFFLLDVPATDRIIITKGILNRMLKQVTSANFHKTGIFFLNNQKTEQKQQQNQEDKRQGSVFVGSLSIMDGPFQFSISLFRMTQRKQERGSSALPIPLEVNSGTLGRRRRHLPAGLLKIFTCLLEILL